MKIGRLLDVLTAAALRAKSEERVIYCYPYLRMDGSVEILDGVNLLIDGINIAVGPEGDVRIFTDQEEEE